MPHVIYLAPDGSRQAIDVPVGESVMRGAVVAGIKGIVAECGGSAMCATCHVYVEPEFSHVLPPMTPAENEMLEATASERFDTSRLSCQLTVTPACEGLVVRLPPTQT
jgi:2Fe-2S ferredoxin